MLLTRESLPQTISDIADLDELLCRPSQALIDDLRKVDGDIMILGVAGKMGPTLAGLAKAAAPERRVIGPVDVLGEGAEREQENVGNPGRRLDPNGINARRRVRFQLDEELRGTARRLHAVRGREDWSERPRQGRCDARLVPEIAADDREGEDEVPETPANPEPMI